MVVWYLFPDEYNVSALAHRVEANLIFWVAGPNLWSMALRAEGGRKRLLGVIGMERCELPINSMAYDWITGNFFFICRFKVVLLCGSHKGFDQQQMLCISLSEFYTLSNNTIALVPQVG